MSYSATKAAVLNRGVPPDSFLDELIAWAKTAPADIFAPNDRVDIYSKVRAELGPWESPLHRVAVMIEVMRVLAGFESSWDWTEGVDTSRLGDDTPYNSEAGAWQVSYDARLIHPDLLHLLVGWGISSGIEFQRSMKFDHPKAMEFVARLMRYNTKHNGPLYKGDERDAIRSSLRGDEHSIYPWLKREAVDEFMLALTPVLSDDDAEEAWIKQSAKEVGSGRFHPFLGRTDISTQDHAQITDYAIKIAEDGIRAGIKHGKGA